MRRKTKRPSPYAIYATACALMTAAATVGAAAWLRIGWLWAYVIAVNLCTFLLYGWDKAAARRGGLRAPEAVLHAMAVAGGTPAAWLARMTFRHKTIKGSFRIAFWAIAALQAAAVGLWAYYR